MCVDGLKAEQQTVKSSEELVCVCCCVSERRVGTTFYRLEIHVVCLLCVLFN